MHKTLNKHLFLYLLIAAAWGCSSKKGLKEYNYSYLYQPNISVLKPQFYIYHTSEDSSKVYFKLNKQNLLYMRNESGPDFTAYIKLRYTLKSSYENTDILDSGSFELKKIPQGEGFLQSQFTLYTQGLLVDGRGLLVINVEDYYRKYEFTDYLIIDRQEGLGAQNFNVKDSSGALLFDPYVQINTPLEIVHNQLDLKPFKVLYYNRQLPLALPPFSQGKIEEFNYEADSTFLHSSLEIFVPKKPGLYHFLSDDNQMQGYTLCAYSHYYPNITHKSQLAEPMRYITTKKEFEYLTEYSHPDSIKYRVDEFWLTRVGSVERGKQLVSAYYNRVADANELFGTYAEGWKTDRGLIYIIYGEPTYTYRFNNGEVWVYGDENSALQYRFDFERVSNPFTLGEYQLVRNGNYKYLWSQAIDAWRNGRIYNVRDIKREQDERDQQIRYQRQPYFWY